MKRNKINFSLVVKEKQAAKALKLIQKVCPNAFLNGKPKLGRQLITISNSPRLKVLSYCHRIYKKLNKEGIEVIKTIGWEHIGLRRHE